MVRRSCLAHRKAATANGKRELNCPQRSLLTALTAKDENMARIEALIKDQEEVIQAKRMTLLQENHTRSHE